MKRPRALTVRGASRSMRAMLQREKDGLRWELSPEFEPLLAPMLGSKGEIVKQSPVTLVTRHKVAGRIFYVKRYQHEKRWWWPLKFFFKVPRSRGEWWLAPRLEALGVPIVPHLAHGERWGWLGLRESVLVTEGLAGYRPLTQVTDFATDTPQRALGKFLRQLHQAGIFQHDLNQNNALYSSAAGCYCLVDLDKIELLTALSEKQRIENLAHFSRFLPLTAAFYEAYDHAWAARADEIAQRAAEKRRCLLAERSRRCWEQNLDFAAERIGELTWQVRQAATDERLRKILQDPDGFLAKQSRILKSGRSATIGVADGLVLKRFNFRKLGRGMRDLFRASRAFGAFRKAYHLELAGVPTARPIAAADRRVLRVLLRSYFVMDEVRGATELPEWRGAWRAMIPRVASLLAKLHQEGFSHRDLKAANIVFDANGQPHLLDLEGLNFLERVPAARAVADLARLARAAAPLTRSLRSVGVLFLRCYCQERGEEDWRWWWREIAKVVE